MVRVQSSEAEALAGDLWAGPGSRRVGDLLAFTGGYRAPRAPDLMPGHAIIAPSRAGATPGAKRVGMRCLHPGPEGWVGSTADLAILPLRPPAQVDHSPPGVSSRDPGILTAAAHHTGCLGNPWEEVTVTASLMPPSPSGGGASWPPPSTLGPPGGWGAGRLAVSPLAQCPSSLRLREPVSGYLPPVFFQMWVSGQG